jgi:hypothetical protein
MLLSNLVARNAESPTPGRIRQIDFVRAVSIWVVVLGHALMGLVVWEPELAITNLLALVPQLQWVSWVLQVMPLFFLAGAAANQISFDSAKSKKMPYTVWLFNRFSRLLSPMFWYLLLIILMSAVMGNFVPTAELKTFLNLATQLLWFLGIYLAMTALTPAINWLRNHIMYSWALLIAVGSIDLIRLQTDTPLGLLNFISGWMFISVLGARMPKEFENRKPTLLAIAGVFLFEVGLVALLPYPLSLVGLPGDPFSNMAPPSLLLVLHGYLFYLIWLRFSNILEKVANTPRVWRFTLFTNLSAMTIYLWHLPLIMGTHLLLNLIGIKFSIRYSSPDFYIAATQYIPQLLAFVLVVGTVVFCFAQLAWPLEQMKIVAPKPSGFTNSNVASAFAIWAAMALSVGTLLFSVVGPAGFPSTIGSFSSLTWSNGLAVALISLGAITIWGGAKIAPPQKSDSTIR